LSSPSAPRDHDPVDQEPDRGIKQKQQNKEKNRAARKEILRVFWFLRSRHIKLNAEKSCLFHVSKKSEKCDIRRSAQYFHDAGLLAWA
jgi:hypothetical protein